MKDIRNIELAKGDLVSFVYRFKKSGELCFGEVVGFTAQMVTVEFHGRGSQRTSNYMPHNLCVIQQSKEQK